MRGILEIEIMKSSARTSKEINENKNDKGFDNNFWEK